MRLRNGSKTAYERKRIQRPNRVRLFLMPLDGGKQTEFNWGLNLRHAHVLNDGTGLV
jgi:hypothetical protein